MLTQRKEGAEKLEGMAKSKGLKFTGLKNMRPAPRSRWSFSWPWCSSPSSHPSSPRMTPTPSAWLARPPTPAHIFGTDDKGRDILSRILYGGRISLIIGFGSVLFALVLGSIVGAWPRSPARLSPRSSCASWTSSCPSRASPWRPCW